MINKHHFRLFAVEGDADAALAKLFIWKKETQKLKHGCLVDEEIFFLPSEAS